MIVGQPAFLLVPLLAFGLIQADGIIEFSVNSTKPVHLEVTVCVNFACNGHDELSEVREIDAEVPFKFHTGLYHGQALKKYDLHVKIFDPVTKEILLISSHKPNASTDWNSIHHDYAETELHVDIWFRNRCASGFYGNRCGRICQASEKYHWDCSKEGKRICSPGWQGPACAYPKCDQSCNRRGICIAPNKCKCSNGFKGFACEQCVPKEGCIHGHCSQNMPDTCECKPGYEGELCDRGICGSLSPCLNGGTCKTDSNELLGYKCQCSPDYSGKHCETPISKSHCSNRDICQNGGKCIALDSTTITCKCNDGFGGVFCEIPEDCSLIRCSEQYSCFLINGRARCARDVEKTTVTVKKERNFFETLWFFLFSLTFLYLLYASSPYWSPFLRPSPTIRRIVNDRIVRYRPGAGVGQELAILDGSTRLASEDHRRSSSPPPTYSSLDLTESGGCTESSSLNQLP
ncbi:hypothetical protein B9Z55_026700 [Caenorhabditis nigoni]|uniref:Delta-like protein n=1 Tax=Caenorhabditis nigoni TaxID=1611254 RepID=A0A2G5T4J2_9PELO|nr:hypothetical protein B9Z55_026700 [Caenorhabditis nigoni]